MTTPAIAITVVIILAVFGSALVVTMLRLGDVRAELQEMRKPRRLSNHDIAGVEDATAVIIDVKLEAAALQARLDTALQILGEARSGKYDIDRPAGLRPKGMRK